MQIIAMEKIENTEIKLTNHKLIEDITWKPFSWKARML